MTSLSLGTAWNETTAFVKREGRLLLPIAFLLIALPVAAAASTIPQGGAPGQGPAIGLWIVLLPAAALIGLIGQVAIAYLALRPGASVGEALARGGRRFLSLLAAYLVVGLACAAVIFIIALVASLLLPGVTSRPPDPQTGAVFVLLLVLIMLPLFLFVWTRMMLSNAIAAAEGGGPIVILQRSWRLTGPWFWQLLGFVVLSAVLATVVTFAVQAVFGIAIFALAGPPRPGNLSAVLILLVSAAINTLVTVFLTTMIARIYAQLVPDSRAEIFA